MKNKEIEELLNKAKDIAKYGADGKQHTRMFNQFEAKALLSYIEQLQTTANECKQDYQRMKENFDSKVDVIATLSEEKKQLENNRDKAIEILNKWEKENINPVFRKGLLKILKGDSDE